MSYQTDKIITCNVCPGECKTWAYYPDCSPYNPKIPYQPQPKTINYATDDFFGQFIQKKNYRFLSPQDVSRFHDLRVIRCPECYEQKLPLNPTSDGFLICSTCNIHWVLVGADLPSAVPEYQTKSKLRPDGSIYRRKIKSPVHNANSPVLSDKNGKLAFNLEDIPF
jgi:hypothetical protein